MKELRPYQRELIAELRAAYREGFRRPCLVLPCGGGKSLITAEMARRATEKGGRVYYLVHRQELCRQIRDTFMEQGVRMSRCRVMMVQTAARRLDKLTPPSLIITDENHHCLASTYRKIYDRFPDVPCIGVTATPVRLNGGGLGEVNDSLIVGPTVKELTAGGYLAPFDYYAPDVADLTGLKSSHGDYLSSEAAKLLNLAAIHGDVIGYYTKLAAGRKAICYCASIDHSRAMAAAFSAAGIPARHIDGETPERERTQAVEAFRRGELQVLTNVDLISEGFDVPDCGAAILLRPTKSLTLYIQQSMRCLRYLPGKRAVIIDHVGNYARFGLPDADREWTLEPKKPAKRDAAPPVRQCPQCFFTFEPAPVCPHCGYVFPKGRRELEEVRRTALKRIEGFVIAYDDPGSCQSFDELRAYAKNKGYKPGWAYYQAKARGFV